MRRAEQFKPKATSLIEGTTILFTRQGMTAGKAEYLLGAINMALKVGIIDDEEAAGYTEKVEVARNLHRKRAKEPKEGTLDANN